MMFHEASFLIDKPKTMACLLRNSTDLANIRQVDIRDVQRCRCSSYPFTLVNEFLLGLPSPAGPSRVHRQH